VTDEDVEVAHALAAKLQAAGLVGLEELAETLVSLKRFVPG
jgi:hypothetical protein